MFNLLLNDYEHSFDFGYIFSNIVTEWYYYVGFLVFIIACALFLIFKKPIRKNNFTLTQKLSYIAILSALCAVINIFLTIPISSTLQFSLIATIGFVAGYIFGGGWAFTACFLGDLIGFIIAPSPYGAYNPITAIATGLWGFVPGIIFSYFNWNKLVSLIVSYVTCIFLCSFCLNTIANWLMFKLPLEGLLFDFIFKALFAVGNFFISWGLMFVAKRLRNYVYGRQEYKMSSNGDKFVDEEDEEASETATN